jgi:site-specific DNA-methyltransferase (adenine-specific)
MNIVHGDCLEVMRGMADNSVDSIVTDPPYGLSFMGKKWDYDVPGEDIWRECLRVLKPGGHLLAFAGTRTQHRMAVRIEDAGFEIRDMIAWVYGSGFPKSHNVGNAVDKSLGCENRGHAISSGSQIHPTTGKPRANGELLPKYEGRTDEGKKWAGFGTALKPAMEPITVARKPLIGTVADNVLTHGTGALNIDGCRVATAEKMSFSKAAPFTENGQQGRTWNPTSTPGIEREQNASGRWPANLIHDGSDEVKELFPETKSGSINGTYNNTIMAQSNGDRNGKPIHLEFNGDSGSAARFFYCAKASRSERNAGLEGMGEMQNHHPTVKPLALMRYLCRLVTPPGGIVLDPFAGSGSTGKACALEGFRFIGIEREAEYCEIARARIAAVDVGLFGAAL